MGAVRAWVPADLALPKMPPASENGWALALRSMGTPAVKNPIPDILIQMGPTIDRDPFDHKPPPRVGRPRIPDVAMVLHRLPDKPDPFQIREAKWAIEPYEARLRLLEKAVSYPVWAAPSLPDGHRPVPGEDFEPTLAGGRNLSVALLLRAYIKLDAGKTDAAVADVVLLRRAANRLLAGRGSYGMRVRGEGWAPLADHAAVRLALSGKLSAKQIAVLQGEVANAPGPEGAVNSIRQTFDRDTLHRIAAAHIYLGKGEYSDWFGQQMDGVPLLDRKATVGLASARFRKAIENRTRPWSRHLKIGSKHDPLEDDEAFPLPDGSFSRREEQRYVDYLRAHPNALGEHLVEVSSSFLDLIESGARDTDARQRVTLAALALLRAEKEEGRMPGTLASLVVTRRLAEVPQDPYSNEFLRYDAFRRTVWSVGRDGKDNGGKGASNRSFSFWSSDTGVTLPVVMR